MYEKPSENVGVVRDQRYGPADRNHLDVFFPLDKRAYKPVLLFVHGGGFFSGDKGWSEKVKTGQKHRNITTDTVISAGPTLAISSLDMEL